MKSISRLLVALFLLGCADEHAAACNDYCNAECDPAKDCEEACEHSLESASAECESSLDDYRACRATERHFAACAADEGLPILCDVEHANARKRCYLGDTYWYRF